MCAIDCTPHDNVQLLASKSKGRSTMTMTRPDPFRELFPSGDTLVRLFDDMIMRPRSEWMQAVRGVPTLDMYETDGMIKVEIPLPGMKLEEIEVTVDGNTLTVKGERRTKEDVKEEDYLRREVHYGTFTRAVTLPTIVDTKQAKASYDAGVLTVTFPRTEQAKPKRLEVKSG
jgi:HSP20 family protein